MKNVKKPKKRGSVKRPSMGRVDLAVRYDKGVGTYSVEPQTPAARVWLYEQTGRKGTVDNLNAEGTREYATRARKDKFRVNDAELPRREP